MPSTAMNRLTDHARVRLPGALDTAIMLELFTAVHDFLNHTNAWHEDIEFPVVASTLSYNEDPSLYTHEVIPTTGFPNRLIVVANSAGIPQRATMPTPGQIVLRSLPETNEVFTARVALNVVDPVSVQGLPEFPEWVIEKHHQTLLHGILGFMMSQTAKPYSAPANALFHMRSFRAGKAAAKVEVLRQNVYGGQNWRYPQTFNRSRSTR